VIAVFVYLGIWNEHMFPFLRSSIRIFLWIHLSFPSIRLRKRWYNSAGDHPADTRILSLEKSQQTGRQGGVLGRTQAPSPCVSEEHIPSLLNRQKESQSEFKFLPKTALSDAHKQCKRLRTRGEREEELQSVVQLALQQQQQEEERTLNPLRQKRRERRWREQHTACRFAAYTLPYFYRLAAIAYFLFYIIKISRADYYANFEAKIKLKTRIFKKLKNYFKNVKMKWLLKVLSFNG